MLPVLSVLPVYIYIRVVSTFILRGRDGGIVYAHARVLLMISAVNISHLCWNMLNWT